MASPLSPRREVLHKFKVRHVAPLGGRLNQHWLVEPSAGGAPLVLRRWASQCKASLDYELRLMAQLAERGWPVPYAVAQPLECDGHLWTLSPFLEGQPHSLENPLPEQRERGRLLARLHHDLLQIQGFGQRGDWRRCEHVANDGALDGLLGQCEAVHPEAVRILRWHLERVRERIAELKPHDWGGQLVHGDFTPWNLRFRDGQLAGILDFELAHFDHRVGEFALAWRGKYDEVVHGYDEVSPLSAGEWELLTPMWWAFLIEEACRAFRGGQGADEWSLKKLLQRSPLMGRDAEPYNGKPR